MKATVLIADDHELVRTGIRRLIEDLGCEIVGEAATGEQTVDLVRELHPDIALIDIQMPGIGGLEASQRLRRFEPDCRVIILTAHSEGPLPRALLETGVAGFLTKGCAFEEMQEAIPASPPANATSARTWRSGSRSMPSPGARAIRSIALPGASSRWRSCWSPGRRTGISRKRFG